jgi:hypothetical protein
MVTAGRLGVGRESRGFVLPRAAADPPAQEDVRGSDEDKNGRDRRNGRAFQIGGEVIDKGQRGTFLS